MDKTLKKRCRWFLIVLMAIIAGFIALQLETTEFNKREHTLNMGEQADYSDCNVSIAARTGNADAWLKRVARGDGGEDMYAGVTYDIVVQNRTKTEIRDWKLRVDITQDCEINSAWCGKIEFHQDVDGDEKVQTLDLRKVSGKNTAFTLDTEYLDENLIIPMHKGDYFVYLPSVADREDTIAASDPAEEYKSVRVGFIAYHPTNGDLTPLKFTDAAITYKLHKNLTDSLLFYLLLVALMLWMIIALIARIVYVKTKRLMQRAENDSRIIKQTMSTFMGFIDAKDSSTDGHSKRVAAYAERLARKYGLSEQDAKRIYYIALMHDCGKIGIPDSVLGKPGKLTKEEFDIIKTHTVKGGKILKDFNSIPNIREGALYHHERYDGKGYPKGLSGEAIPLVARIICVADAFDAMNSDRCYRKRLSTEEITEQLKTNRGTQFDPKIADCMLELLKDGEITFDAPEGNT